MYIYRSSFNPEYLPRYQDNMGKKADILNYITSTDLQLINMVFPLTMKMNPLYVVCSTNTETDPSLWGHYPLHCTARSRPTVPLREAKCEFTKNFNSGFCAESLRQHDSVLSTSWGCPMPVFRICFSIIIHSAHICSTWLNGSTRWEAPLVTLHTWALRIQQTPRSRST
jgi:hypothetical protein